MIRGRVLLWFALLGACDSDDGSGELGDAMPEDFPAGNCRDNPENCDTDTDGGSSGTSQGAADEGSSGSTSGGGTTQSEDACQVSTDCLGEGTCAAEVDPETTVRSGYRCQFVCVPTYDDASWCSDDAGCCEPGATCSSRGYCIGPRAE